MNASLVREGGVVKFKIDGKTYDPVAFRAFWPQADTVKNFDAQGFVFQNVFPSGMINGIGLPYSSFGPVWEGEGKYNWDNLDRQIALFYENAPHSLLSVMVHMDTRPWFLKEHPECADTFNYLPSAAAYEPWRQAAARYMTDLIDYLDERYPDRFFALILMAGGTTEWYSRRDDGRYHPLKEELYKAWTGDADIRLPLFEQLHSTGHGALRHPTEDAAALDYWHFHNESVADTLCHFAGIAREHTRGTKLIGAFGGYLTGVGAHAVPIGDDKFHRISADENIDFLCCPASYRARELHDTSGFRMPVDSLTLRGKAYFHEIDNMTWRVNDNPHCEGHLKQMHALFKDLRDTVMYLRREVALAMSKGVGYWWFDMFNGWYDDPDLMDELGAMRRATGRLYAMNPRSVSEVAAFVHEESLYYPSFSATVIPDTVEYQGLQLNRMGLPWDQFVLQDIHRPDFPHDQYRLYVFHNLLKPDDETRRRIRELRRAGKSLLFIYAAGYIEDQGFSEAAMSALTGIDLMEKPPWPRTEKDIIVPPGTIKGIDEDILYGFSQPAEPLFAARDGGAKVWGRYADSGQPAFVVKQRTGGFDAWSATGNIPGAVLRELARQAGAFVYSDTDEPLYANSRMMGLFSHTGGERILRVPRGRRLIEMYSGEEYSVVGGQVRVIFEPDEMKTFIIE